MDDPRERFAHPASQGGYRYQDDVDDETAAGYDAASLGQPITDNPYHPNCESFHRWNAGWHDRNSFAESVEEFVTRILESDPTEESFKGTAMMAAGLAAGAAGLGTGGAQAADKPPPEKAPTSQIAPEKPQTSSPIQNEFKTLQAATQQELTAETSGKPHRGEAGSVPPTIYDPIAYLQGKADAWAEIVPWSLGCDMGKFCSDYSYKVDAEDILMGFINDAQTEQWYLKGDKDEYYQGMIDATYEALNIMNFWPNSGKPVPGTGPDFGSYSNGEGG